MGITQSRLLGGYARLTLTLRVRPPSVVGVAFRRPMRVSAEQRIFVGEMVVYARVVLIVDASDAIRGDEVVDDAGCVRAFRRRVGYRKKFDRSLVKPIRADYVEYSVALKLRISPAGSGRRSEAGRVR